MVASTVKSRLLDLNIDSLERRMARRILCPVAAVVESTNKPQITAVAVFCKVMLVHFPFIMPPYFQVSNDEGLRSYFSIPEWIELSSEVSWTQARMFIEDHGFPVVLKGRRKGSFVCNSWTDVENGADFIDDERMFLQKQIIGIDHCLAFAAFEGALVGCCLCSKINTTPDNGKLWSGHIDNVPAELISPLTDFVRTTCWTGGGEIEYIEHMLTKEKFLIDFNPRFGAWISASHLAGCNLPAELLQLAITMTANRGIRSKFLAKSTSFYPIQPLKQVSFSRSVEERLVSNLRLTYKPSQTTNRTSETRKGRLKCMVSKGRPIPLLPIETLMAIEGLRVCGEVNKRVNSADDQNVDGKILNLTNDLVNICQQTAMYLNSDDVAVTITTPCYVLSQPNIRNGLNLTKKCILCASKDILPIQMFLSVKTQPAPAILRIARELQFYAECISLAEVLTCLSMDFDPSQIILTGPGKWWKGKHSEANLSLPSNAVIKLRAIFADSIQDLEEIILRASDCHPPSARSGQHGNLRYHFRVDAAVVGIRWAPCSTLSRFGLNSENLNDVLQVTKLLSKLAPHKELGMQFHHAASTLGGPAWFEAAQKFVIFSATFAQMTKRRVSLLDFGGGWNPYFFESPIAQQNLHNLFLLVAKSFSTVQDVEPTVQFEPGKCITENAGSIITRILSIREANDGERAIIVDTCIGELSSPHVHPVFYFKRPKSPQLMPSSNMDYRSNATADEVLVAQSVLQSEKVLTNQPRSPSISEISTDGTTSSDSDDLDEGYWVHMEPANGDGVTCEIWGRTCMEFDKLSRMKYKLPTDILVGDVMLFTGTGAYDMSMSYSFGDGVGRDALVLN